jgi:hypothetical protein
MFVIDKEDYENVERALSQILLKLMEVKKLEINDASFDVEWFLAADYKMLAILYGLNAANSHQACVWCTCDLYKLPNKDSRFPINRTLKNSFKLFKDKKDGYVKEPIIKFIDFKNCVIDLLHLFLRISDKLFDLLISKLIGFDGNDSADLEKRPSFKIFYNLLSVKCNITKPFFTTTKDSEMKIKLRSLNGEDRSKVFEKLFENFGLLSDHFPENLNLLIEDFVWREFYQLFLMVKSYTNNPYDLHFPIDFLEQRLRKWLTFYLKLNSGFENLSCYVHAFVFHIPEMIKNNNDINIFNCEGLEKLNDFSTQYYRLCSNKHKRNNSYISQMIDKRNRIEFFSLDGNLIDFF